jgi:hypothetical protein
MTVIFNNKHVGFSNDVAAREPDYEILVDLPTLRHKRARAEANKKDAKDIHSLSSCLFGFLGISALILTMSDYLNGGNKTQIYLEEAATIILLIGFMISCHKVIVGQRAN